jgi:LAO/AO transport system kinase
MNVDITRDFENLLSAITSRQVRAGAKLISRIERDEEGIVPILQALYRFGGHARIIGITGPPGVGKSTLINKLVGHWRRDGLRVAVLAVDPSSPFTGGAVLGDRLRMTDHCGDDGVFIRSMASRGQLGGLSKAAGDAITVLDAMHWDVVLVETVGVGQNETDIMRHASVVVLLQTPMGGDDIQAAKAGITEIGDIFVVNKSDHPEADRTASLLEEMIALGQRLHVQRTWRPPVVKTQALQGEGVAELAHHIDRCFATLAANSVSARERLREQTRHRIGEIIQNQLNKRMRSNGGQWLDTLIDPVLIRESDPYAVADELLTRMAS